MKFPQARKDLLSSLTEVFIHPKGKDKEELRCWNPEIQLPNASLLIRVHRHLAIGRLPDPFSFHISLPFQSVLKNLAFQIFNWHLQKKCLIRAMGKMEAGLMRVKKPHMCWEEGQGKEQFSLSLYHFHIHKTATGQDSFCLEACFF